MKDIRAIVTEMGLQLTDEQLDAMEKMVREGYVTRNELEEKKARITSLTEQVKALGEQVQGAGADAEKVKALTEQVEAFQRAEQERKALEAWTPQLDKAIGSRTFANSVTEEAVRSRAWATHRANPDMGVEAVLAAAIGDSDGIWANAQADPKGMPLPSGNDDQAGLRDFAAQLFGRSK